MAEVHEVFVVGKLRQWIIRPLKLDLCFVVLVL